MSKSVKKNLKWYGAILVVVLISLTVLALGCQAPEGVAGPQGPAGATGATGPPGPAAEAAECSDCHNDTTLILSKSLQSATTTHMIGRGWSYAGGRASCTACHSSEGFQEMVATGVGIGDLEEAPANPSPQNCRTCHEIHTTYTAADWALKTTAPVTLLASGETFDMGDGNLCATCHQPRRLGPEEGGGDYEITSTHWGPHHGPQSTVLLGISAYGVPDATSIHYTLVADGCPVCHMADDNHTLAASTAGCQSCHAELDTLDRNGVQTEIKALFDELGELLEAAGLLHDGHPNPGTYTEEQAGAAWNWMIVYEDNSRGIHNPSWIKAILEKGIELMQ